VGRALGIDYGERRIGIAISDPTQTVAQPLAPLLRRRGKRPPVQALLDLIAQHEIEHLVVGLPLSPAGDDTDWTREVRDFGNTLAARAGLGIDFVDERMTSAAAERAVRSLGLRKSEREQKERVDTAAAMLILQAWLNRVRPPASDEHAAGK